MRSFNKSIMFRGSDVPARAEEFLVSDFRISGGRGPSVISSIGQLLPDRFECPRCSRKMAVPEHGVLTVCAKCDLHMVAHGNSLKVWKA